MPRQARLDSPGTLHHVMVRGVEKRRIVDDETDRRNFVRRLGALAEETRTAIYAWALMSNHAHLLVCSGALGLAKFMRRLLTGYAVSYNLRHRRHRHLFQNRYKSIVCDGDSYFTELVRYIHLNPLSVGLVKDLKELEKYPYCGHGTILGRPASSWQDCDSVLAQFGRRASEATEAYRRFVAEGIALGRRPELVGGGLTRSAGNGLQSDHTDPVERGSYLMSGYWGVENLWSASLERRGHERSANLEREREIVTPSVWWPRNARKAECR